MAEAPRVSFPRKLTALDLQMLMESHGERLLRSAFLLCGNESDAQDLTQETFLQALRSVDRFRGESAVYTWLHGILLNLSRRRFRDRNRLLFGEDRVLGESVQPKQADNIDSSYCAERLAKAIQGLSLEHREVVVLRYYGDLKINEIADQIGVSKGTVKSRLHYAVRRLEELIPKEMNLFTS